MDDDTLAIRLARHHPNSSFLTSISGPLWTLSFLLIAAVIASFVPSDIVLPHTFPLQRILDPRPDSQWKLHNGSHEWEHTVLLFSLDGLKPDYMQDNEGYLPTLHNLSRGLALDNAPSYWHSHSLASLNTPYMRPVSPSLTFPNHWSLLTGLEPSSHGIIANDFHAFDDQNLSTSFYYTDPNQSWDPTWWKGEPVWETVELAGLKTANLMWPGPPQTLKGTVPFHFQRYEKHWTLQKRHEKILQWLDLDADERPRLICAYAPDIDSVTHSLGPYLSIPTVIQTLQSVDRFVAALLASLSKRNATHLVDLLFVSDHGMTPTSDDRLFYLDDILGKDLYSRIVTKDGWPNVGMRFKDGKDLYEATKLLYAEAERSQNGAALHERAFEVWNKAELVKKWQWKGKLEDPIIKERVADLWIIPKPGWSFTDHREMEELGGIYYPRGNHGYDRNSPDMQATFFATGPSFKTTSEARSKTVPPFDNVEIYNLVLGLLHVDERFRKANNGTSHFWDNFIKER